GRLGDIVDVPILRREILKWRVPPIEVRVLPRRPWHEEDRVESELCEVIQLVNGGVHRGARLAVVRCEVVQVELIDDQVAEWLATGLQRFYGGARTADGNRRVLVCSAAVARAWSADPPRFPVV